MVIDIFISTDDPDEIKFPQGLNLIIQRCDDAPSVTVRLVTDGDKDILDTSFDIDYEELKKAILKLGVKEE
jgi:hypothetical protein